MARNYFVTVCSDTLSMTLRALLLLGIVGSIAAAIYVPPLLDPKSPVVARTQAAAAPAQSPTDVIARCGDGDTCTLTTGEVVRLLDIDAPELGGARCANERVMAVRARDRLSGLAVGKRVNLDRSGRKDKFNRTLAHLAVGGRDAGGLLMSEGLAVRWRPGLGKEQPGPWC